MSEASTSVVRPRTRSKKSVPDLTVDRVFEHLLRKYTLARDIQTVQDLTLAYGRVLEDREQVEGATT